MEMKTVEGRVVHRVNGSNSVPEIGEEISIVNDSGYFNYEVIDVITMSGEMENDERITVTVKEIY